jgi:hypothetical protein
MFDGFQNVETVGTKEEVLNLLVKRTDQCKKMESKISGEFASLGVEIYQEPAFVHRYNLRCGSSFSCIKGIDCG